MKKILLIVLSVLTLNATNFRVGMNTENYQDCEGGSISILYKYNEKLNFETSYHEFYIRGVQKGNTTENWNSFNTQRFGIRYYLKSYANDEIKLFTSIGLEHIYKNDELSSNTPKLNTYGLVGVDFKIDEKFNITFAFGSSGKGEIADKLETDPNYAHGFNSVIGIEYNF